MYERHGMTGTKVHMVWKCIKVKCTTPKSVNYPGYGGRGIRMVQEFLNSFTCFHNYLKTLPNYDKYISGSGYSLDRRNNEGHYERGNLRFVTLSVQTNNTRPLYKNNSSGYKGVCFHKGSGKFWAHIKESNIRKSLGLHTTAKQASEAREAYVAINPNPPGHSF